MARVPILEGQSVQTAPLPDVRMDPRAFGSDIAQGLTQAGQALGNVAEDLQKVEDQRIETAVMQRDVEWMTFDREQRWGENGLFKKPGQEAVNARPVIEKAYAVKRDELLKTATTVQERRVLTDLLDRRHQSSLDSINEYASKEGVAAYRGAAASRAFQAGEAFAQTLLTETDPAKIEAARGAYDGAMDDNFDAQGLHPATREVEKLSRTGAIHMTVLDRLRAEDKTDEAEAYLEQHGWEMTVAQKTEAGLKVHEQSMKRDAQIAVTEGAEFLRDGGGGFSMPVAGDVGSGFGPRKAPLAGASTFHTGVDIKAPAGSPVKATAAGEVIEVGSDAKSGNFVKIKHRDGRVSSYSHLESYGVEQGDQLAGGSVLGKVGSTGNSTGPHLHFTLTDVDGETKIDPRTVMGRPPPPLPGPDATQEEWRNYADVVAGGNRQRRDVLRAAAQGEWTRLQGVKREREQKAWDAVQPFITAGSGVTSWTQISSSILGNLSPEQLRSVKDGFATASARTTGKSDPLTEKALSEAYYSNPKKFAELNALDFFDKLSPEDFDKWAGRLADAKKGKFNAGEQASMSRISGVADRQLRAVGLDPRRDAEAIARFESALWNEVSRWRQANGKEPDDGVILGLSRDLLRTVDVSKPGDWTQKRVRAFAVDAGEKGDTVVPKGLGDRIRKELVAAGRPATENDVRIVYRNGLRTGLFALDEQ